MLKSVPYYLILLFLVSLPFDHFYSEVVLITLTAYTVLLAKRADWKKWKDPRVLTLEILYGVTLLALAYGPSRAGASEVLFQQLPFLLFPWLCAVYADTLIAKRDRLFDAFSITCAAIIVYLYVDAFRVIHYFKMPLTSIFTEDYTNQSFTAPLEMHATYLSIYTAVSLLFCIRKRRLWLIPFLVLGLIQLSTKTVFASVILILVLQGWRKWRVATIAVLAGVIVLSSAFLHKRMITDLRTDLDPVQQKGFDTRLMRWEVAWSLVKAAPVSGYGLGSMQANLDQAYLKKRMYQSYLYGVNTHNQFLSWWLSRGILGVVVYTGMLIWGFYKAFSAKDPLWIGFLVLVTLVSFSENLLEVQHGLFFMAFFFSFFPFTQRRSHE